MKFKIGVFGSAVNEVQEAAAKARELGRELGLHKLIVLTGAGSGLPNLVAKEAAKNGAQVWGFPPAGSLEDFKRIYPKDDPSSYKKLVFIPNKYEFLNSVEISRKYRNVTSTATCDAGIIISGRWGTLNEFTNLYDMGKIIGVLTGTGGAADEIPNLMKKISKESKAQVVYNDSPRKLLEEVLSKLKQVSK